MEFTRLVKAVLHKDVSPCVSPDPRLVEDLAQRMGNITIMHKGCPDLISNGKVNITFESEMCIVSQYVSEKPFKTYLVCDFV